MKSMIALLKKELTEHLRSVFIIILAAIFFFFGIMNPVIAKGTPWLLEQFSESDSMAGLTFTAAEPVALDSWMQFFKNIPMILIAFVFLEGNIFTKEYGSGTLILSLTKGLARYKVVISKALTLILLWTLGYGLYFGSTYALTEYFWSGETLPNLGFAVFCWWLFGVFAVALMVFFSTLMSNFALVLLGVGGTVLVTYFISIIPKFGKFLPTFLMDGNSLIGGLLEPSDYTKAIIVTAVLSLCFLIAGIPVLNKRKL